MKRFSVNKTAILFTSIITILATAFMFTLHLHNKQQAREQQVFDEVWADMVDDNTPDISDDSTMTIASVSVQDSMIFQYLASLATVHDMPEELPIYGDTMVAYVSHDTIYTQHWHNYSHQQKMFRYVHGE